MAPKMDCTAYESFNNFMNIPNWIPGKPGKLPVPRRAHYGVTTSVSTVHSELQATQVSYTYRIKYTTFAYEITCIKNSMLLSTHMQENLRNGMKSTVTLSNTPMLCSVSQLHDPHYDMHI